ncbi:MULTISPECIES: hypothetical protein [Vibrio harveyi group]|uniref:hypothetical protein n=1 Tax=Vibrio harveyi group TaxID=717610 RepID=UPI0026598F49|nr:hypothetical protein [Vibrio antiquarius]MCE9846164.1 hypothetical protein [Vibrio antiquarius]
MPVKEVFLHTKFFYGRSDSDIFRDFSKLSDSEYELVEDFVDQITLGEGLKGRNKPSWLDKHDNEIRNTQTYKDCNVWHYHAGPHSPDADILTKNVRDKNLGDNTSDAVIHYTWHGKEQDVVVILGFSPQHKKFPMPSDRRNVLRSRMVLEGDYPNNLLVDFEGQERISNDECDTDKKAS